MTLGDKFLSGEIPMTQMLLFDATADLAESTAVLGNHGEETPANIAAAVEHDSGLHHMGDLARLVLLRYELVAKRRAAIAARKAARVR